MLFNVNVLAENETTGREVNAEATVMGEKFTLDKEKVDVFYGGVTLLSATGGDSTQEITWESSDTTVATVIDGRVHGENIGTATITATRGTETVSCEVNVIYNAWIAGNKGETYNTINLVLGEHETETLRVNIQNVEEEEEENILVEWSSSDPSIVTVGKDSGGLKAIKEGTATITATAEGIFKTCEVTVFPKPEFTDFSNAKYETLFEAGLGLNLKISEITLKEDSEYYYMITSNETKPTVQLFKDIVVIEESEFKDNQFNVNTIENFIFMENNLMGAHLELNQDAYLWIVEKVEFGSYYDEEGNEIPYKTKFVVEGKKLERPKLQLDQVLSMGWASEIHSELYWRMPSGTENRKCTVKIGEVTNDEILKKIQNNDYSGITDLLVYAKNDQPIYTSDVSTTVKYGRTTVEDANSLFDEFTFLIDGKYYYVYTVFDDEEGKYYPVETINLAKYSYHNIDGEESESFYLDNTDGFEWENLDGGQRLSVR